ncbi:hypothetical protein CAPTEDRAFT_219652 [Capitella teleta]|uniref:G-protein coupled receptors family 1 profile domain-containing protein n=1 Tax=Capitella teleta TaxID=283909 RepID=R7U221_CAPTE|nr:hypothetical protein CAPTEDRAFT_219652 [Capitella teleta]|eukprot:ELT97711.1 hypothetical protein CAPTEDRAFT_219652 [Capitella teleta]
MPHVALTLPPPLQRDVDVIRLLANVNATNSSTTLAKPAGINYVDDNVIEQLEKAAWALDCENTAHVLLPIVLGTGLLLGLLSLVGAGRRVRTAGDTFLVAFLVCSELLMICGLVIKLQEYMEHSVAYEHLYGYIKCLHDWLWFSTLWILIVMTLERAMSAPPSRSRSTCSRAQAAVVSLLICGVCLLSALPQFWEYEVTETFDYGSNQTIVMAQLSELADSPQFAILYFWYAAVLSVLLPFPLFALICVLLVRSMRKHRLSRQNVPTSDVLSRRLQRSAVDEHGARLCLVLILLYVLCTGPASCLVLAHGVRPHWTWSQPDLYAGLFPLLELVFYFFYATVFFLLLSYSDRFRRQLRRSLCCCCPVKEEEPPTAEHSMLKPRKAR